MTETLARREPKQVTFSSDQIELVKKTIMPPIKVKERGEWLEKPATQDELDLFLYVCGEKNLNPLVREIYCMRNREGKITFMTSIDGLRIQAERAGFYAGQKGPFWCGQDGAWKEVWLEDGEYPAAAKVGVLRHGFQEPVWGIAKFKSYAQWKDEWKDGKPTGKKTLIGFWAKGDEHMLAKCAEAIALRKAFPTALGESGAAALYIAEEAHAISGEEKGSKEAAAEVASEKVRLHEEKKALEAGKPAKAVIPEPEPNATTAVPAESEPNSVAIGPDGEFLFDSSVSPDTDGGAVDKSPSPRDTPTAPRIEAVTEKKTKKNQPYLIVKWNGNEWFSFHRDLNQHIKAGLPAQFQTSTEGKYKNIVGAFFIGNQKFDKDSEGFLTQPFTERT